jgi:hypothetical protein
LHLALSITTRMAGSWMPRREFLKQINHHPATDPLRKLILLLDVSSRPSVLAAPTLRKRAFVKVECLRDPARNRRRNQFLRSGAYT